MSKVGARVSVFKEKDCSKGKFVFILMILIIFLFAVDFKQFIFQNIMFEVLSMYKSGWCMFAPKRVVFSTHMLFFNMRNAV